MTLEERDMGRVVELHATGKINRSDYREMVPALDRIIQQNGKINVLVDLSGLDGWTAGALWEDLKFDARHFTDFRRIAIIGGKKWQKNLRWMARPFTTAKIRCFEPAAMQQAREWAEQA